MSEHLDIAREACREAVKHGAEFADVKVGSGRSVSINVEKNGIHDANEKESAGVSVRSIVKGATGNSSCSGLGMEGALEAARRATEAAKLAQPDPDFVSLPAPAAYDDVPGLYDEKAAAMSAADLIGLLGTEVDAAREVSPDVMVQGGVRLGVGHAALASSLGVEVDEKSTSLSLSIFAIVRRGDEVGSFYDFDFARRREDFDAVGVGASACREAVGFLGSKSPKSATLPVVFGPLTGRSLCYGVCAAAGAEGIQRGRSYMIGKRGKRIGSELLTLVDDGFIPGGMLSGPYDDEGAKRRKVTVVEDGVLVNHLHGSYTANKAGEENTGHGSRGHWVGPTNVIPKLGTSTAAEILADTKEGIYVNVGSVSPHPVHGEISATIDFGHKIENGRLAYPLRNAMLGINVFDLLENLDAISSDYREEPGMILPTIRVQNVKIAGAG